MVIQMQENTLCSCFEVQKWNMCSSSQSFVSRASCLAVTVEVHQWVESRGKSSARVCLDGGQQGKGKEHLEGNWVLSSFSITFWWWDRWQYIWGDFPCLSIRDHIYKKKKNQRETNVNKWEAMLRAGKLYAENGWAWRVFQN